MVTAPLRADGMPVSLGNATAKAQPAVFLFFFFFFLFLFLQNPKSVLVVFPSQNVANN